MRLFVWCNEHHEALKSAVADTYMEKWRELRAQQEEHATQRNRFDPRKNRSMFDQKSRTLQNIGAINS